MSTGMRLIFENGYRRGHGSTHAIAIPNHLSLVFKLVCQVKLVERFMIPKPHFPPSLR